MIAVFINCVAIIAGSLVGLLFSKRITGTLSDVVSVAAGLVTLVIGFQMASGYQNIVYLALAMILGGITGSAIDIDRRVMDLGKTIERALLRGKPLPDATGSKKNFALAFLNASVLFCVGAMSILGSIQAGVEHEYTIIMTKSVLDGFLAAVFAAAMGIGTIFSALTVFVYQGSLTLAASAIASFMTDLMLSELSASGGVMLMMIGINLTGLRTIKTANYLPALLFSALFVLVDPVLQGLATSLTLL
jgi:uncharacterized membrane protein YqgA involved in biofilm formation